MLLAQPLWVPPGKNTCSSVRWRGHWLQQTQKRPSKFRSRPLFQGKVLFFGNFSFSNPQTAFLQLLAVFAHQLSLKCWRNGDTLLQELLSSLLLSQAASLARAILRPPAPTAVTNERQEAAHGICTLLQALRCLALEEIAVAVLVPRKPRKKLITRYRSRHLVALSFHRATAGRWASIMGRAIVTPKSCWGQSLPEVASANGETVRVYTLSAPAELPFACSAVGVLRTCKFRVKSSFDAAVSLQSCT
jgi:hypothetical protein